MSLKGCGHSFHHMQLTYHTYTYTICWLANMNVHLLHWYKSSLYSRIYIVFVHLKQKNSSVENIEADIQLLFHSQNVVGDILNEITARHPRTQCKCQHMMCVLSTGIGFGEVYLPRYINVFSYDMGAQFLTIANIANISSTMLRRVSENWIHVNTMRNVFVAIDALPRVLWQRLSCISRLDQTAHKQLLCSELPIRKTAKCKPPTHSTQQFPPPTEYE